MRAAFASLASAAFCLSAVPVVAQTAPEPTETVCPTGAVSVYFASGEVTVSRETQALLGKIRQTATSCQPDRIELLAHVDPGEGEAPSLRRAQLVVDELVSAGLAADRIHVAAREVASEASEGRSLHAVEVLFRQIQPAAAKPAHQPSRARAI